MKSIKSPILIATLAGLTLVACREDKNIVAAQSEQTTMGQISPSGTYPSQSPTVAPTVTGVSPMPTATNRSGTGRSNTNNRTGTGTGTGTGSGIGSGMGTGTNNNTGVGTGTGTGQ